MDCLEGWETGVVMSIFIDNTFGMKKKSNIGLLNIYSKKNVLITRELLLKRKSQIEAQKKILDLIGKIEFWDNYEF